MAFDKREEIIAALKGKEKIKVLFVCLGNICRSPAADGVMHRIVKENGDSDRWEIDSAGTGNYHIGDLPDKRMRVHGSRRGYNFNHICRQVCDEDFFYFDLIIPMDKSNEWNLDRLAPSPESRDKIIPMSHWFGIATRYDHVPDPYYEGAEGFELVLDLLEDGCHNLYKQLTI